MFLFSFFERMQGLYFYNRCFIYEKNVLQFQVPFTNVLSAFIRALELCQELNLIAGVAHHEKSAGRMILEEQEQAR
mgnify:CR=1 FL=1